MSKTAENELMQWCISVFHWYLSLSYLCKQKQSAGFAPGGATANFGGLLNYLTQVI